MEKDGRTYSEQLGWTAFFWLIEETHQHLKAERDLGCREKERVRETSRCSPDVARRQVLGVGDLEGEVFADFVQ